MSEQPKWDWRTIAIVALVGYVLWSNFRSTDVQPDVDPTVSITKTLEDGYRADRVSKVAILKGITSNQFASDQAKLDWINSESAKRREADFAAYTAIVAQAIFDGTTDRLASDLEAGR